MNARPDIPRVYIGIRMCTSAHLLLQVFPPFLSTIFDELKGRTWNSKDQSNNGITGCMIYQTNENYLSYY